MKPSVLRRQQIDRFFESMRLKARGPWIKDIRQALGMSMDDLARRMGVIKQRIDRLERDEKEGKVTLQSLARAAEAMDCELVYFFVPRTSLEATVENQAKRAAQLIVERVDSTMSLEAQKTSPEAKAKLLESTAAEMVRSGDRSIWKY